LIACSKPTQPLSPNEIVEVLLDIPPYPSPPLTEDNASNESFLVVVNQCNGADYSLLGYKSRMQRLLVNKVEAVNIEGNWQWILNEYGSITTLTVVPKDTLSFVLDVEHYGRHFITVGWIVPNGRAAEIIVEGGPLQEEYLSWNWVANDLWFSCGIRRNPVRSFMSSTGQGWLAWDGWYGQMTLTEHYFYAAWNSYGHGYYESSQWGSGSW
jgi:hypothetical protein